MNEVSVRKCTLKAVHFYTDELFGGEHPMLPSVGRARDGESNSCIIFIKQIGANIWCNCRARADRQIFANLALLQLLSGLYSHRHNSKATVYTLQLHSFMGNAN